VVIYSLRPVSMLSDLAQRKTDPKSEMTHCFNSLIISTAIFSLLLNWTDCTGSELTSDLAEIRCCFCWLISCSNCTQRALARLHHNDVTFACHFRKPETADAQPPSGAQRKLQTGRETNNERREMESRPDVAYMLMMVNYSQWRL